MRPLLLFVHSADDGRLRSAAALAAGAVATGREATLVWEGPALRRLAAGELPELGPAGLPGAAALLRESARLGGLRQVACPTALVAEGLDPAAPPAALDGVEAIASLLERLDRSSALYL